MDANFRHDPADLEEPVFNEEDDLAELLDEIGDAIEGAEDKPQVEEKAQAKTENRVNKTKKAAEEAKKDEAKEEAAAEEPQDGQAKEEPQGEPGADDKK